ncbi:hypothetical protein KGA66_24585 [Actinocrinis puniceicyclus]|uniref:Uncharacterized protein n=1 Tax=Actinocrinis puniceicyclus TaxID=977794 RepID=A0A8J7WT17_9ACTN|nr:hypothetical protein [Actinocrinis puniceicyclus]MBS2966245.1 hypothetical protein [Actinocrinis puniceicyclus]
MATLRRSSPFSWDAAGLDRALALASADARAGMLATCRDLLAETRCENDFARRGYASAVLGSACATSNAAELWTGEDPDNPDAWLVWARVAAIRALRFGDRRDDRTRELIGIAVRACHTAVGLSESDPTPQVILLGLDRLRYRRPTPAPAPLALTIPGPWDQLARVARRDRHNREAGHQLLNYYHPRHGGDARHLHQVASWAAKVSLPDSPLQLLPLVADLEAPDVGPDPLDQDQLRRMAMLHNLIADIDAGRVQGDPEELAKQRARFTHRLQQEQDPRSDDYHRRRSLALIAKDLYEAWFGEGRTPPYVPIRDLSVLAHALYVGEWRLPAAAVLQYLGPHACTYPWSLLSDDPEKELIRVYRDRHVPLPREHPG